MNETVIEYSEANSNKFTINSILVTALILYVTWILNLLNVFIVDSKIYLIVGLGTTIISILSIILYFAFDLNKGYVKYIFLFLCTALYAFITSCLTYHTIISLVFPIIFSAQYRSKKVVWYTYTLTIFSIIFSVFFGYYFGLCDANMLVFTSTKTSVFIDNFSINNVVKNPNWYINFLYYAFPKALTILCVVPMVFHLNNVIDKRTSKLIETQNRNLNLSNKILQNQKNTIVSLASIIESRDKITGNHIKNTAEYVEFIVKKMIEREDYKDELTHEYGILVVESAPLHDIGKIHIPDSILCKEGKLTEEEYNEMKKHPKYGCDLLHNFGNTIKANNFINIAQEICLFHHERWDGNGYPAGLKEHAIPLSARIMAVADVLDALLSKRHYKEAYSFQKALAILKEEKGKQFDPIVLDALLDNWEEFVKNVYTIDEK